MARFKDTYGNTVIAREGNRLMGAGGVLYEIRGDQIYDNYGERLFEVRGDRIYDNYGNWVYEMRGDRVYDTYGNWLASEG